jgi:hypothetical protein
VKRTALLIILVLLTGALYQIFGRNEPPSARGLQQQFGEALLLPDSTVVDVTQLATFPWTKFCVVGPYVEIEYAEEVIGTDWPFRYSPHLQDGHATYVFLDNDSIVAVFETNYDNIIPIREVNFCREAHDARLRVNQPSRTFSAPHFTLLD